jgi:hypothetical protein
MAERALHGFLRDLRGAPLRAHVAAYAAIVWNTLYAPVRH